MIPDVMRDDKNREQPLTTGSDQLWIFHSSPERGGGPPPQAVVEGAIGLTRR
jgi:hypothetical protein